MKKVLFVCNVLSHIQSFHMPHIKWFKDKGYEVHILTNAEGEKADFCDKLYDVDAARSPFSTKNIGAYKRIKEIITDEQYDLIHCHTPTISILTRLAAKKVRKKGCKVMYTAHGFHFHNSSPKKNWLMFYPVERFLSRYCDYLITINQEDFNRAKTFHCKNVRYIPSVGVDINRIKTLKIDKGAKKEELGVPRDKILIISVGELIPRKNHEVIIRALAKLDSPDIYYAIAGKGVLKEYLTNLAKELGVSEKVIMLGYRTDVYELYYAADISAFPSRIEGLGLAGVEAMAAGVPLVSSNVHGILDYVIDGKTGYAINPSDVDGFAEAIEKLAKDGELRESMRQPCLEAVEPFELSNALRVMWDIYEEVLGE